MRSLAAVLIIAYLSIVHACDLTLRGSDRQGVWTHLVSGMVGGTVCVDADEWLITEPLTLLNSEKLTIRGLERGSMVFQGRGKIVGENVDVVNMQCKDKDSNPRPCVSPREANSSGSAQDSASNSKSNQGAVIGGVVGGFGLMFFVLFCMGGVMYFMSRKRCS